MPQRVKSSLQLAKLVAPSTDVAVTIVPDDGAEVYLDSFDGAATGNERATSYIAWDYGTPSEEIVAVATIKNKKLIGTGDGVKKVALILSNLEPVDSVAISAEAIILEIK